MRLLRIETAAGNAARTSENHERKIRENPAVNRLIPVKSVVSGRCMERTDDAFCDAFSDSKRTIRRVRIKKYTCLRL